MRTNTRKFRLALTALTLVAVMLSALSALPVRATAINVPGDYSTIQAAIDAATTGDTVLAAPGTYVENIDFKGKAITVKSTSGASMTTIDGNSSGTVVTFNSGEGPSSVIEGFTITNGNATNSDLGDSAGGGILCDGASPIIRNNIITKNYAKNTYSGYDWDSGGTAGGGIACNHGASPIIEDNTISHNTGYSWPSWGASGGGISVAHHSKPTISHNTISHNLGDGDANGGGILCIYDGSARIEGNIITHNRSESKRSRWSGAGGGITCYKNSHPYITNNLIAFNTSIETAGGQDAGGIFLRWDSYPIITNSTIAFNDGGDADGLWDSYWMPQITNSIFWHPGGDDLDLPSPHVPECWRPAPVGYRAGLSYSNVGNGYADIPIWALGPGNISADPLFVYPATDDFRLGTGSPSIDTGINQFLMNGICGPTAPFEDVVPNVDLEGRIRPWDGNSDLIAVVDMGAYEYGAPLPDTEGPITSDVAATPNPAPVNTDIYLTATVDDTDTGGSNIASAEYSLDGDGVTWHLMDPGDGAFDEVSEDVEATILAFTEAGVHEVCVRGTDAADNTGDSECIFLAVYDPDAGFVTGGGWIDSPSGAHTPEDRDDPDLTGKATFGFVSKYQKGATVPTGQTEFQFKVANLNFHSSSYDWLVIAGARAQYKGTGTINGAGNYGFMLTAIDGNLLPNGQPDKFRIKIWDKTTDSMVYDNQPGALDTGNDATALGGGSIVIHKK